MNKTNIKFDMNVKEGMNLTDEFVKNINLKDLGLILKQATNEIENGIKGKDAFEALDEIELEVFGELL